MAPYVCAAVRVQTTTLPSVLVQLATCIVGDPSVFGNRYFSSDPEVIRDNCNDMFVRLRSQLLLHNVELNTEDISPPENSNLVLQMNVPRKRFEPRKGQVAYLFLWEPEASSGLNWDRRLHVPYDRVLTWNESWADGEKYFLFRFGYDLSIDFGPLPFEERRFCSMIAAPKTSNHPLALYRERASLVRWMQHKRPNDFDLYGPWWPTSRRPLLPFAVERRLPGFLRAALDAVFSPNPVVRGPVSSKRVALRKYRFSICFENMRDLPGFVTEKIFDSMCAGCVPVYWGASNIADLVPPDCFIDRRSFRDTAELVAYLDGITSHEFACFQSRIRHFLGSAAANPFRGASFADALTQWVLEDLGLPQ